MARVFGVELVILLTLGFSIGALTFQCWRGTRQLAAVQMDNEQLKASMQQTESRAKTAEYRRSLVQSDLEQLQVELDQKERTLNQQVTELRGQLEKVTGDLNAEKLGKEKEKFDVDEMQGIQDQLMEELETCKKSLKKCETMRNALTKSAARDKSAKEKELSSLRMTADEFEKRALSCEAKLNAVPP